MTTEREMIEANRANWDARVPVHLRGYDLDHLRAGGQRLADFENAAIDVAGLDEIIGAALAAGLRLTGFAEHDVSVWGRFPGMTDLGNGWWGWPAGAPRLPLMFSMRASSPRA